MLENIFFVEKIIYKYFLLNYKYILLFGLK